MFSRIVQVQICRSRFLRLHVKGNGTWNGIHEVRLSFSNPNPFSSSRTKGFLFPKIKNSFLYKEAVSL